MLSCEKKTFEAERLVGSARFQIPVRAESPVPGAGRESAELIMEDAFASIASAEAQEGRVLVSGRVQCQAVYRLGAEGGLQALTARAAFEQAVDLDGVGPNMTVRAQAVTEHVEAAYDNGHIVFSVSVGVGVRVRSLEPVEALCGISGGQPMEVKTDCLRSVKISAENTETAELSDSVSLPAALHARVALMQWASARIDGAARDLGGVRVSGEVQVESLIASSVPGRPVALVRCPLPFEQLVVLPDWVEGEPDAEAEVSLLNVCVEEGADGEDALLKMDCALAVTVRLLAEDCADVVTDAYAAGDSLLNLKKETFTLCTGTRRVQARETFRGTLPLPEGAPPAGTALAARIRPVVSGWSAGTDGSKIEGLLEATVLYMPSGGERLTSVRGETPFSLSAEGEPDGDAVIAVEVREAEAAALMSDRMELKCVLQAAGTAWKTEEATVAADAEEQENVPRRRGIGIVYPGPAESLWAVGRRCRVSQAALKTVGSAPDSRAVIVRT